MNFVTYDVEDKKYFLIWINLTLYRLFISLIFYAVDVLPQILFSIPLCIFVNRNYSKKIQPCIPL